MYLLLIMCFFFFFQAEDGIRDKLVTGVQTCALPILQRRVEQLEYAFQTLDRMPPRIGLPYAGPPAFLEDSLFRFNDDLGGKGIVPDQKHAHDWLRVRGYTRRLEIPLPGDRLNLINGEFMPDQAVRREFSFDRKDAYLKAYADRMRPAIAAYMGSLPQSTGDLFEPFRAYVLRLGEPQALSDDVMETSREKPAHA